MKKLILSALLILLTVGTSIAQLTKGEVKYKVEVSSDDPSMDMAISMMQGTKMSMYFSGGNARTEVDMGAMMSITTIVNGKTDKVLMLMGGMMGKIAIPTTTKELEEANEEKDEPEVDIELTNETKKILGYLCKKAILTDEDGNEIIYWYTAEIEVNNVANSNMNSEVPGFPLEFETTQYGMQMSFRATEFNTTLSEDEETLFDTSIPEGYEVMTMEDMQNMGM